MARIVRYCLLMLCLFFITTETDAENKIIENKKQCRNLICLFDMQPGGEQLFGDEHAMLFGLIDALREQVAPIIVTTDVLRHFCYWKMHPIKVVINFLLGDSISSSSSKIITQFTDKDWYCYAHKQAELMLLVPKKYIVTHVSDQVNDLSVQIEQCGFDVSNCDKINDVSPSIVLDYIDKHKRTYGTIIDYFESMFIKRSNSLADNLFWNIYVTGHGNTGSINRSYTAKTVAQRIRDLQKAIKSAKSSAREIKQYEEGLAHWQKISSEFNKHGVVRSGYIAGLEINDFFQLISFFEKDIQTLYLHYATCFSSGFNQTLVNEELSRINVRFIVSAQGINEDVTYAHTSGIFDSTMLTNFFSAVERFFCNTAEFTVQQKGIGKDSIRTIVDTVVDKSMMDWDQPFVRIPEVGVFKAFSVDEQVKILTNSMVRAHQREGISIDFTDSKIETIFVYPSYVSVPLKIKGHVAIVSPAPQKLAESKETVHMFEKIIYNDQLFSVIANFVSFNTRYEPIIFVIKELHCRDYSNSGLGVGDKKPMVIKDMIIYIKGSGNSAVDVAIDVVFSLNGIFYSLSTRKIKAIQSNVTKLFGQFKEAFANPATQLDFNELALDVIGSKGMQEFKDKEITIPLIIQYLESKIDKSVLMKKSSASKNVLLLKKLEVLEHSVTQEVLKKSTLLRAKSLGQAQHDAENLKKEIDALPQEKLSAQARIDLQTRIMNVQTIIKKEYGLAVSQLSWFDYAAMKMSSSVDTMKKVGNQAAHKVERLFRWSKKR